MPEHILFLTGKLAERQLHRTLEDMAPEFEYTVHQIGLSVAALMTTDMIRRRLKDTFGADRVLVPGRCRGDLDILSADLGIPFQRGPDELHDLPEYFGKAKRGFDLNKYDIRIFAEIVDAPDLEVDGIVRRARDFKQKGADVIDLGCLPSTPFAHLEQAVTALKSEGFMVSVDSLETDDLLRGGKAGADYVLSLREDTLWVADEIASIPVLIPAEPSDLQSLYRAMARFKAENRSFIVDPILDPIHFGFTESLVRYREVRLNHPEVEIMMGVGNLTELTHADTAGMNALLLGICSELGIRQILATEVSKHARGAIREADLTRRIMFAAREANRLPKHIDDGLMALHERSPFPIKTDEIIEMQKAVKDPSYRIIVSSDGIHIFNRDGLHSASDPFTLYPRLGVENDGGHAFYLGVELGRAQIAYELGKRYNQDEALTWGCQTDSSAEPSIDPHAYKPAGSTLQHKSSGKPSKDAENESSS